MSCQVVRLGRGVPWSSLRADDSVPGPDEAHTASPPMVRLRTRSSSLSPPDARSRANDRATWHELGPPLGVYLEKASHETGHQRHFLWLHEPPVTVCHSLWSDVAEAPQPHTTDDAEPERVRQPGSSVSLSRASPSLLQVGSSSIREDGAGGAVTVVDHDQLQIRALRSLSSTPRPFLRWAGSKQRLLPQLVPLLPPYYANYFEPFLGSASLFFVLRPPKAVLGDSSKELIETYKAVRDGSEYVRRYLTPLNPEDKPMYYRIRSARAAGRFKRAAEFIYLNRSGWNGLYRVNSRGEFNVPYGAPKTSNLVAPGLLDSCSHYLQESSGVVLLTDDFEATLSGCGAGDLVFLDPPYVTGHNNNGFVDYNQRLFSWEDQVRLARVAQALSSRGCHVLVTNAYHDAVIALYPSFDVTPLDRSSTLAGTPSRRRQVREVVLRSYSA